MYFPTNKLKSREFWSLQVPHRGDAGPPEDPAVSESCMNNKDHLNQHLYNIHHPRSVCASNSRCPSEIVSTVFDSVCAFPNKSEINSECSIAGPVIWCHLNNDWHLWTSDIWCQGDLWYDYGQPNWMGVTPSHSLNNRGLGASWLPVPLAPRSLASKTVFKKNKNTPWQHQCRQRSTNIDTYQSYISYEITNTTSHHNLKSFKNIWFHSTSFPLNSIHNISQQHHIVKRNSAPFECTGCSEHHRIFAPWDLSNHSDRTFHCPVLPSTSAKLEVCGI